MTIQLPSEIVVERFLPTIRSMLAAELADRGFAQREIAARLGVSQAAISQYLSGKRPGEERFAEEPRTQATVERIADGFEAGTMDDYEALAELLELVWTFEDRGPICAVHEEEMPALAGTGCDLCVRGRDRAVQAEREALSNVRHAVRRLSNAPDVATHVPNVGTNVAMALPEATAETDVAAIPGRIHAMHSGLNVPSNPEFGASHHVATTLIAAADADPAIGGAVNLATSDALLEAIPEGSDALEFDADYENRRARLDDRFADGVPRIVYHEGAFGIEPITYVLGTSAVDAVDRAIDLVARAEGRHSGRDPQQ